jgi:hypothetical protein
VAEMSGGTLPRRWQQIAEWLEEETLADSTPQQTRLLVEQFLDFLRYQHATVVQIRSGISQGLASYQKNHSSDSVLITRRVRSLAPLAAEQDLQPLHDLLMMMNEALLILGVAPQPKLDSGRSHGGWIGYNLNNSLTFRSFSE